MLSGAISESSGGYARREVLKRLSVCFFSASPGRKEGGRLIAYSGCSSSPALISAVAHADPGSGWAIPYRTGSFTGLLAVFVPSFFPLLLAGLSLTWQELLDAQQRAALAERHGTRQSAHHPIAAAAARSACSAWQCLQCLQAGPGARSTAPPAFAMHPLL